jgi:hypothetical protein
MDLSRFLYSPSSVPSSSLSSSSLPLSCVSSYSSSKRKFPQLSPSPAPSGLSELYFTPNTLELPLSLLLVGHNPSEASWKSGHYYSNPSNRMWPLLRHSKLIPSSFLSSSYDTLCPSHCHIGFTDLMIGRSVTESQKISKSELYQERFSFYERVKRHCERVRENIRIIQEREDCETVIERDRRREEEEEEEEERKEKTKMEDRDGEENKIENQKYGVPFNGIPSSLPITPPLSVSYSPRVIAFAGIRQWKSLFPFSSQVHKTDYRTSYGIQTLLPPDWPREEFSNSIVFLLPTPSGAAPMSVPERQDPYVELGELVRTVEREGEWAKWTRGREEEEGRIENNETERGRSEKRSGGIH